MTRDMPTAAGGRRRRRTGLRAVTGRVSGMPSEDVSAALVTQVEVALLAGRNLGDIESEILTGTEADEETLAAAWLYAWSRQRAISERRGSHS
jgi:hypothetical protein